MASHEPGTWQPSPRVMLKVSVDVAFNKITRKAAVATVVRDSSGKLLGGDTLSIKAIFASSAEAFAIFFGMNFALKNGFKNVIVEFDNLGVVNRVNSKILSSCCCVIHHYLGKLQVSILNGIVMGGGAGISVHGRFRVATENTSFAMPEAALGLFPDVAASYFLSRLPGFFGEYVGLTGSRLDGAEMLACGLATHFVPSAKLPLLEAALCDVDSSDPVIISSIIDQYSKQPSLKELSVYNRLDVIDRCFSQKTVEEIISALEREDVHQSDSWISATIQTLKKSSPTSLKIFLRSIREGRLQGVGQCLVREYRMVSHVMQGELSKDFFEGCRATLLDKDKNPNWEPSKLELIDDGRVDCYFCKVKHEEWEDLKLPNRSKFELPPYAIAKL